MYINNIRILIIYIFALNFFCVPGCKKETYEEKITEWKIDNIEAIGGYEVEVLGSPMVSASPFGRAVKFDGKQDALIIAANPISEWSQFTIEVLFHPDSSGEMEQRFIHIQEIEDHRVLIEIRLAENGRWFLDTYMKSGESDCTLSAKNNLHLLGQWYHAALVYDGRKMYHFVNGDRELEGEIEYTPMQRGETSIGCRLNRVFWYKGTISKISFSSLVLTPESFTLMKEMSL